MMSEELVDIIAEEIFRSLADAGYIKLVSENKVYADLNQTIKNVFEHTAHNVLAVFDEWYDCEADVDVDEDYDEDDNEDFNWPLDN